MNRISSALTLLAVACPGAPAASAIIAIPGPRIAVSDLAGSRDRSVVVGNAAVLSGRLATVGNCIVIEPSNGARIVPVFPSGVATWNNSTHELRYFTQTYALGEQVRLGGGSANDVIREVLIASPDVDIPSDCPTDRIWVAIG